MGIFKFSIQNVNKYTYVLNVNRFFLQDNADVPLLKRLYVVRHILHLIISITGDIKYL